MIQTVFVDSVLREAVHKIFLRHSMTAGKMALPSHKVSSVCNNG